MGQFFIIHCFTKHINHQSSFKGSVVGTKGVFFLGFKMVKTNLHKRMFCVFFPFLLDSFKEHMNMVVTLPSLFSHLMYYIAFVALYFILVLRLEALMCTYVCFYSLSFFFSFLSFFSLFFYFFLSSYTLVMTILIKILSDKY
jgi:hypothetical protein